MIETSRNRTGVESRVQLAHLHVCSGMCADMCVDACLGMYKDIGADNTYFIIFLSIDSLFIDIGADQTY